MFFNISWNLEESRKSTQKTTDLNNNCDWNCCFYDFLTKILTISSWKIGVWAVQKHAGQKVQKVQMIFSIPDLRKGNTRLLADRAPRGGSQITEVHAQNKKC